MLPYLVIGLFMWGKRSWNCFDIEGGSPRPVPQFGGTIECGRPLEGNICLKVDHSSHLVLGIDGQTLSFSLICAECGVSRCLGTQWLSGAGSCSASGATGLCLGTGAVTRRSVGMYLFVTQTVFLSFVEEDSCKGFSAMFRLYMYWYVPKFPMHVAVMLISDLSAYDDLGINQNCNEIKSSNHTIIWVFCPFVCLFVCPGCPLWFFNGFGPNLCLNLSKRAPVLYYIISLGRGESVWEPHWQWASRDNIKVKSVAGIYSL